MYWTKSEGMNQISLQKSDWPIRKISITHNNLENFSTSLSGYQLQSKFNCAILDFFLRLFLPLITD